MRKVLFTGLVLAFALYLLPNGALARSLSSGQALTAAIGATASQQSVVPWKMKKEQEAADDDYAEGEQEGRKDQPGKDAKMRHDDKHEHEWEDENDDRHDDDIHEHEHEDNDD